MLKLPLREHMPYLDPRRPPMSLTQVGEFGSMYELIRDPKSRVHQLAQTQGIVISDE